MNSNDGRLPRRPHMPLCDANVSKLRCMLGGAQATYMTIGREHLVGQHQEWIAMKAQDKFLQTDRHTYREGFGLHQIT